MTMLILREEIVCAVVLLFIIICTVVYKIKSSDMYFLRVLYAAFLHVLLDVTTVITVNNRDVVPDWMNKILHLLFYFFGILFIMELYAYIVNLTIPHNLKRRFGLMRFIPFVVYILSAFILPIEYRSGRGTDYSYGPMVFMGYGIFVVYCLACLVLIICFGKKIDRKAKIALFPMLFLLIIVVVIQGLVPELLMTGAAITFICLGLFTSLNNPAQEYRERAYWDEATGIKNKNAYHLQLEELKRKCAKKKTEIGFLIADLNGLKRVNDTYGHVEGDKLIKAAGDILREQLKHAYDIYRVGGDEFVAIYYATDNTIVEQEMQNVVDTCEEYKESPIALSIALGYASGIYTAEYMNIYQLADERMYEHKMNLKKQHPELQMRIEISNGILNEEYML